MSWSGLASNQIVSDTNLANACATGIFVAKTSIPSTGKELTKTAAIAYAYVDAPSKASSQLVTKGSLSSSISVTVYWYVGNQTGGNLKVLSVGGSTLLDITSTAGTAQSGTLTVASANLPYTVRGTQVSAGAVAYRVCDNYGSELFYSGSITGGNHVDYTPSPTPTIIYVNLTSNGTAPPICI